MGAQKRFEIKNLSKGKPVRLPFLDMKEAILGKSYELSLVFANSTLSKKLHHAFKGKRGPANVLSFPLSQKSGEIFIDPKEAKRQAPAFRTTAKKFIGFLFIHGLLHLKGLRHGSTMESKERKFRAKFRV